MVDVVTESGQRVPGLALRPSLFIDRTAVLYGPSGSGKTVIVKSVMKLLDGHIEQILVVSPTEPSNRAYEGFVHSPLIHYRMFLPDPKDKRDTEQKAALRFLERIYQRQDMMAAIYKRASRPEILAALYGRLSSAERAAGDSYIASLERKRRRVVEAVRRQAGGDHGRSQAQVKEVDEKFQQVLVLVYKKYLAPAFTRLWERRDLSEDEQYSLHYLNFNPRLLLIFDDCAAELKPFFNKDVFRKLFYQNRHSYISVVLCCQDDTDLPTNLRKNAFVSIFAEPIVCSSNFERVSNKFPKATKAYVSEIIPAVFGAQHRKLVYIREDPRRQHFYHVTCSCPAPFMFGSAALAELCGAVRSEGVTIDKENPYYEKFKV